MSNGIELVQSAISQEALLMSELNNMSFMFSFEFDLEYYQW